MKTVDVSNLDLFRGLLTIEELEPEDVSYIGFEGKRVEHSCEQMDSGREADFCDSTLYLLSSQQRVHLGWTYACKEHLASSLFRFATEIEERLLEQRYDEWNDKMAEEERNERSEEVSFNTCRICLCDMSEHNWEIHNAEMKAGY